MFKKEKNRIWTSKNYISFQIEHKFDISIQQGLLNIINYLIGYEGHEGQIKQDWKVFQTNRYKKVFIKKMAAMTAMMAAIDIKVRVF